MSNLTIAPSVPLVVACHDLATSVPLASFTLDDVSVEVRSGAQSVWTTLRWPGGQTLSLRSGWCPASALACTVVELADDHVEIAARSMLGRWRILVTLLADPRPIVRVTSTLRPEQDLRIDQWPRDLVATGPDFRPDGRTGVILGHQVGPRSGLVFARFDDEGTPSFLYFQNLSALNDLFAATRTSAASTVGGEWPLMGLALPPGTEALPHDEEFVTSDAFVCPGDPEEHDVAAAPLFLDLLSSVYLHLPRPRTEFVDWPELARRALADLSEQTPDCWSTVARKKYLRAYVGDEKTPPESMVQLAVLLPLCEYQRWTGETLRVVRQLTSTLPTFWDERRRTLMRWLPAATGRLDGSEDHIAADVMDSWYVYHPLLNLSRLAQRGDETAKKLFLDSLGTAMRTAKHFGYRWPVLYNVDTLDTVRAETSPGNGGEVDVAGMHAHVMLQAYDLTGDRVYLDEAIEAAKALEGLRFDQCYQLNATAFTTGALVRLWRATGDGAYLTRSLEFVARIFLNVWMWDCNYGFGVHYPTFFCLCPLPDAPYASAYEELETAAALTDYLALMGEDAPTSVRILVPEMLRHLLNKGSSFFPAQLPDTMVSTTPKTGHIDRNLWVPLEDMRDGWDPSGQVGQEIYGVGAAFEMVVRHYWRVDDETMLVHCDYPIRDFTSSNGRATFEILGDPRLHCRIRLLPGPAGMPNALMLRVRLPDAEDWSDAKGSVTPGGDHEFECPGSARIEVHWQARIG